jgi:hypothetical protein
MVEDRDKLEVIKHLVYYLMDIDKLFDFIDGEST